MSGTKYAESVGDAENNCWGVAMTPYPYTKGGIPKVSYASKFTFDQAMKGGGVGVTVQRKYVNQIPQVKNHTVITFVCDPAHPDYERELAPIGVKAKGESIIPISEEEGDFYIQVEDSRQGWANALEYVIDAHYEGEFSGLTRHIVVDVSLVRERGRAIVGFGGEASGPAPLVSMLDRVQKIISSRFQDYVTPTEWGDVIQNIGTCVVAGNVRRTALILLGDESDKEYVESKNYSLPQNLTASQWRWASNNSVDIGIKTDRETLRDLSVNIYYNGEPGYINTELAKNYARIIDGFQKDIDGEVVVFNPCGEISLPQASPCNLFEVNLPRIHDLIAKGIESESLYEEAFYLATRYAYRVTFRPYEWEATREIVYRQRRLGVGITGITDWFLKAFGSKAILGFDENQDPIYNEEVTRKLDEFYGFVKKSNIDHSRQLGANPSIKVTTVKPSGTVSLLMGSSPGQHFHWSPFMIRRVRLAANAPLVPFLMECGYHIEPAIQGFDDKGKPVYNYQTLVCEFPVKAPTAHLEGFQSAKDVSLEEQAAIQSLLAKYWSDNAVSATLSFHKAKPKPVYFEDGTLLQDKFGQPELKIDRNEENAIIEQITDILDKYKGIIKSTSLLPHATDTYPQMPYEEITEEKYNEMVSKLKANIWDVVGGSIQAEDSETLDSSLECIGSSCPVK